MGGNAALHLVPSTYTLLGEEHSWLKEAATIRSAQEASLSLQSAQIYANILVFVAV